MSRREPFDLRDDAALEALLAEALDEAGRPAPFPVDVTRTVMARVAEIGPPPRTEIGWREIGRWAIAASIAGLVLLAAAAWQGPSLGDLAQDLSRTTVTTADTAAKLSQPAGTVAAVLGRAAVSLWEAARRVASPLDAMRPLAQLILAIVATAMAGITSYVLARDLRATDPRKEQA